MRLGLRRCLGYLPLLAVAACVTPPPVAEQQSDGFARTGRFALNVEEVGRKPEAVQGGFAWRDEGSRLVLDLANPVGSTLARLEATAGGATLTHADGRVEYAADVETLLAQVLGGPMPVTVLRAWLRGKLAEGSRAENVERDADGQLMSFTQQGWEVRLWRYDAQGPLRLNAKRQDGLQSIDLRLVVQAS
ncbi:lipoprotein insertase outer membrane protein LolB [Kerstersia gyiorum]|uniref:Outer-membrane lipoprotein LolB n=1 Tax=Kerstersia gyiorum TaxID=206506 RepID=A0A171KNC2_9BURK|nr:lipoprotein insertase outer membrane protein LolB [Kerstersia gyiorum]AZV92776.1 outer membrane lipoprotein LolB [Bordetella sp. J329]MCO7642248.1 lipoprotein insertase outer membrane protein LolB [Pseudomonas sp. S 311-6]KAB0542224.1 outer membrane lipoprotein LolB [Kerstersia gyiorum]KKO70389.1 hypothetical protein AAV32_16805 [Kerstersia gyiorum]MCP1633931.1 outer membrane lipoprotein LolB [Kerstersia gyiorum]